MSKKIFKKKENKSIEELWVEMLTKIKDEYLFYSINNEKNRFKMTNAYYISFLFRDYSIKIFKQINKNNNSLNLFYYINNYIGKDIMPTANELKKFAKYNNIDDKYINNYNYILLLYYIDNVKDFDVNVWQDIKRIVDEATNYIRNEVTKAIPFEEICEYYEDIEQYYEINKPKYLR